MLKELAKISYKYFGELAKGYSEYFDRISIELKKADIHLALEEYVSIIFFLTVVSFGIAFPLSLVLLLSLNPLLFPFSFVIGVGAGVGVFVLFFVFPSLVAGQRKAKIDAALPYATTYLANLAGAGLPPSKMFSIVAEFGEYGELAKEMKKIVRDTEVFGLDVVTALERTAERTPSEKLETLLWGIRSNIAVGGDLKAFLLEKSKGFMNDYRQNLDKFSAQLSIYTEIYMTIIVVGSIFFIVMAAIMTAMGGASSSSMLLIQNLAVYVLLPVVSIGYMILLRGIQPGG